MRLNSKSLLYLSLLHFIQESLELLYILHSRLYLETGVEVDADAFGMMEGMEAGCIFRSDAATQEEWDFAIVLLQNLPIKQLAASPHRLAFGVEKEEVNSAYILLIFLNVGGIRYTDCLDDLDAWSDVGIES